MSTGLLTPDQAAQRLDTTLEDLGRRRREGRAPAYYAITRKTIRYHPGDLHLATSTAPDATSADR